MKIAYTGRLLTGPSFELLSGKGHLNELKLHKIFKLSDRILL